MAKTPEQPAVAFHTIVVSTDGTPFAMRAVDAAFKLALRDRAKIIVITVVDTSLLAEYPGGSDRERGKVERELNLNAEEALRKVGALAQRMGADAEMILRKGRPHIEIILAAYQAEADLIVIGKGGGRGSGRDVLGGVTRRVLEDADCSVLIVR